MPNNTAIVGEEALIRVRNWANDKFITAPKTATVTIAPSDWANLSCTKIVTGMTPSKVVFISPVTTSFPDYIDCGVRCTAQGTDTLSFACNSVPSSSVVVNVLIIPNQKELVSITVSGDWENEQYIDSDVDITGLTVTALFSDGATANVTSLSTVYPSSWASTVGTQTAMFYYTYNGVTKTTSKDAEVVDGARLPAIYQEVEYLQSTGTQWIDTGVYGNLETKVEMKFALTSLSQNGHSIFGSRERNNMRACMIALDGNYMYAQFDSVARTVIQNPPYDLGEHTVKLSKNGYFYDDILKATYPSPIDFTTTTSLFAFTSNEIPRGSNIKIHSLKIYDNDVVTRDLVPCYRKADNVAGMYDLVSEQFFINVGTGEFIVGPNVTA